MNRPYLQPVPWFRERCLVHLRLPIPRHDDGRGILASQRDRFLKVFREPRPAISVDEGATISWNRPCRRIFCIHQIAADQLQDILRNFVEPLKTEKAKV